MRRLVRAGRWRVVAAILVTLVAGNAYTQSPRPRQGGLKLGDAAPGFSLPDVEGTKVVTLSDLKGKPIVLIFGSCT